MTLNFREIILTLSLLFLINACGNYSFTGASIPEGT